MAENIALKNIKEAKKFGSVRHNTQKHGGELLRNKKEWIIASSEGQGTCQDSALHMENNTGNGESLITLEQCAGQCRDGR